MNLKLHERRMPSNFNLCFMGRAGMKATGRSSMQPLYRSKHVFLAYCNCKLSSQPLRALPKFNCLELFFAGFLGSAKKGDPLISPQLFKVAPLAHPCTISGVFLEFVFLIHEFHRLFRSLLSMCSCYWP